jgi:hypothetical protein
LRRRIHITHLTPLNGIPSERKKKPTRADARESDRQFELLADLEELVYSYDKNPP